MEAANRGASEAKGMNIGLGISTHEQHNNPYITRQLSFQFHYFHAKTVVRLFGQGGGSLSGRHGTLDELSETLTLVQTKKIAFIAHRAVWKRF